MVNLQKSNRTWQAEMRVEVVAKAILASGRVILTRTPGHPDSDRLLYGLFGCVRGVFKGNGEALCQ